MLGDLDKMALCEYTLSIKKIFNKYIMSYQTKTIPLSQIISSTEANVNSSNYQGFPSYQGNDNTNFLSKPNPLGYQEGGEDLSNKCVSTYIDFNTDTSINTLSNYGITQNPNAIQVLCVGAGGGKGGDGGNAKVQLFGAPSVNQGGGNGAPGTSGVINTTQNNYFKLPSINTVWSIQVGNFVGNGNGGNDDTNNHNDWPVGTKTDSHGNDGNQGSPGNKSSFTIGNDTIITCFGGVGGNGGSGGEVNYNGGSFNNGPSSGSPGNTPTTPTPNIVDVSGNYYPAIPNNVGGPGQNGFVRIYFKY